MEDTPVAPTGAAPASEAPINSNQAPAAPATPTTPAQAPLQAAIPADRIEAFNRFVENNGGFEKAFETFKSGVSRPQNAMQPNQPHANQRPVQQMDVAYQQQQQQNPYMVPRGYVTPQEVAAQQYFNAMASEEKYAPIANEIRSGEIFQEMGKFGISPVQNGMFNDRQIRSFLDLYAKTKPAIQTTETVTSTPTVDYVNVGEQVTSRDDALKILAQNQAIGGSMQPHPQTEAAKAFLKEYYSKKK